MAHLRAPEAETDSIETGRHLGPPGRTASGGGRVPAPRLTIAEVPDWVIQRIDQVAYPTRIARRRALEAARTVDGWEPDAAVTAPLLGQVAVTLVQMPGGDPDRVGRPLTKSERRTARRNQLRAGHQEHPEDTGGTVPMASTLLGPRAGRHAPDVVPAQVPPSPGLSPVQPVRPGGAGRSGPVGRLTGPRRVPAPKRPPDPFDTLPPKVGHRGPPRRVVAGVLLTVMAASVAVVAVLDRDAKRHASGVPGPVVLAPQQVLAVALARQGQVTGVSLLASGSDEPQQVLVPSRLLLDVPGAGRIPVGQSLGPGGSAPGAALGDALEIRVAGTWVVSTAALTQLVDDVGGVTIDVDRDLTRGSAAGAPILVAAGPAQRLTGAPAAEYAQFLVGDEPEASRLARQDEVLTAVLGRLPVDTAGRRAVLAALPGAPTGAVLDVVVAVTGGLRAAAAAHSLPSTVLPVRDIDTGGAITAYGLDSIAANTLVQARLAGAALDTPAGGRLRVLVQNGVGTPGLGEAARVRLVAAGLRYVGGGNIEGFGVTESVVLLPDGTSANRSRGMAVTQALGLPGSALRISDTTTTVVDVVVVLGRDFSAS